MEKFEKIIKEIKKISLSGEEKAQILGSLSSYVKETPVMEKEVERQIMHGSLRSRLLVLSKQIKFMPTIAILLMLFLGGGASLAANSALPGDVLYPIKLNVNEKIEAALAFGAEADAKVEAKHAERRLEEAEELAVSGQIDAETKAEIEARF